MYAGQSLPAGRRSRSALSRNGVQSASCQTVLSNGYNPYTRQYDATLVPSLATRQGRPTRRLTTKLPRSITGRPTSSPGDTASRDSIEYELECALRRLEPELRLLQQAADARRLHAGRRHRRQLDLERPI